MQTAIGTGDIETALNRLRNVGVGSSGDPDLDAFVLLQEGRALLFLGRNDESEVVLGKSLAHARLGDAPLGVMYCLGTLGGVAMSRGDVVRASALADEALAIGRTHSATGDPTFQLAKLIDSWCRYIRMDPDAARLAAESAEALRRANTETAGFADGAATLFGLDETGNRHSSVTTLHAESPCRPRCRFRPAIRAVLLPAIQYAYLFAGETGWRTSWRPRRMPFSDPPATQPSSRRSSICTSIASTWHVRHSNPSWTVNWSARREPT